MESVILQVGTFLLYALGFVAFLIVTQDFHIFPGAVFSLFRRKGLRIANSLPPLIESHFIPTKDGKRLEVWEHAAQFENESRKEVAIIFHGNGAPLETFLFTQMWFSEMGIKSYCFDYRGFGASSGWPSEQGLYEVGSSVADFV